MALPRESAFLPTIKCSTCGRQIEISMMGEHVCSDDSRLPPKILSQHGVRLLTRLRSVPPLPPTKFPMSTGNSLSDKYDRMPPSLDTNAASMSHSLGHCIFVELLD